MSVFPIKVMIEGQPLGVYEISPVIPRPVRSIIHAYNLTSSKMIVPSGVLRHVITIITEVISDSTFEPGRIAGISIYDKGNNSIWMGNGVQIPRASVPVCREVWSINGSEKDPITAGFSTYPGQHFMPDLLLEVGDTLETFINAGGTMNTHIIYYDTNVIQ
jgi:hypothetical protein